MLAALSNVSSVVVCVPLMKRQDFELATGCKAFCSQGPEVPTSVNHNSKYLSHEKSKCNTYEHSGKLFCSAYVNMYVGIQVHILEMPPDMIQIRQEYNHPQSM